MSRMRAGKLIIYREMAACGSKLLNRPRRGEISAKQLCLQDLLPSECQGTLQRAFFPATFSAICAISGNHTADLSTYLYPDF